MTRPDVAVMRDLLAKVKAATGPDREIDAEIWWLFAPHDDDPDAAKQARDLGAPTVMDLWWGKGWRFSPDRPPRVTRSQDAAVSFFKQVFLGYSYCIRESGFGGGDVTIHDPMQQPAPGYDIRFDHSAGPCLALVGATLTALIAAEDRHG